MFLSSRNNQFKFEFPRKFIPDEIADKYRAFINRIPGGMIKEPIDIFNYGIQSINLPGPSFDPVTQNDYPGFTRNFRDAKPTQELFDRNLTVTMQSFDGFINYWMAVELMQYYYSRDGKQPWVPEGVGLQLMDGEGNLFMTARLQEMIMTGVGSLDLNFSSNTVDFQTFDITFVYNTLEIKSIATERVRALPISVSQPIACLPAQILLNGNLAVTAPSGVLTDIRVLQAGQPVGMLIDGVFVIPPCEDAQWELVDNNDGVLGAGVIASGEGAIIVAPNAAYTLEDTIGNVLGSGAILSGGSEIIVAPDANIEVNGTMFGAVTSGSTIDIPVINVGSNQVGSLQVSDWVIGNNATFINSVQVTDQEAEVDANISVELDGNPSGSWNAGTQTWEVTGVAGYEYISDFVSPYSYIGTAISGSATSALVWNITRIDIYTLVATTPSIGIAEWDNRLSYTYI
jgi:hypothetical protein